MTKILLALAALTLASSVSAETLYSKTFWYGGTCNAQDQVPAMYQPWETVSINIVGVEVAVFQGSPSYVLAGNSFSPDIMLTMGQGEKSRANFFPPGMSFPFPAARSDGGPNEHIDAHISCPAGQPFQFYQVIYYTKNPA